MIRGVSIRSMNSNNSSTKLGNVKVVTVLKDMSSTFDRVLNDTSPEHLPLLNELAEKLAKRRFYLAGSQGKLTHKTLWFSSPGDTDPVAVSVDAANDPLCDSHAYEPPKPDPAEQKTNLMIDFHPRERRDRPRHVNGRLRSHVPGDPALPPQRDDQIRRRTSYERRAARDAVQDHLQSDQRTR